MFKTRLLTSLIGIPLVIAILIAGGVYIKGFIFLIGFLGVYEFDNMMKRSGHNPPFFIAYLLMLLLLSSVWITDLLAPAILFIVVCSIAEMIVRFPQVTIKDIAISLFASAYIGFLLNYGIRIAEMNHAFVIILLCFIITWSSDVGGYLAGRRWGKHKMTPVLSPNKTWEGAVGSILMTALASYLFIITGAISPVYCAVVLVLAIMGSALAQCGDLFMSAAKRYFGVKDSSHIIPGHGGVLDRFDSILLVMPVVYYFFIYSIKL